MSKFKNIIFDFDGTLAHTAPDISEALRRAYQKESLYQEVEVPDAVVGPPIRDIITSITPKISAEEKESVVSAFREYYDNSDFELTSLYPGVLDLLKILNDGDFRIFIVTNKPSNATRRVLDKLGITQYFETVVCPDTLEKTMNKSEMVAYLINRKALDKNETVMIGDTSADILAANSNGIESHAVSFGYGDIKSLEKANPAVIIEEAANLQKHLL